MKLIVPITLTATDSIARTITGRVLTWSEQGRTSAGLTSFMADSIKPKAVKLNLEHDLTRPIGRVVEMVSTPEGLNATFKIAETTAGTDALIEAASGLRDGFSVGVKVDQWKNVDGVLVIEQGSLEEVSLVTDPAIKSAMVSDVAASENSESEAKESEAENPTTTQQEGDEVETTPTVPEASAETVEAAQSVQATNKPVFYTKPRLEFTGAKYLENKIQAALGSEDARQYVIAADNNTTDSAGLVPTRQLLEVINGLSNTIRPSIDAISRGTLPDAGMTFEIPKITVAPTAGQNNEGAAFSDTNMESAFVSVPVKKFASQQNFTVELLTRTSPLFYDELLRNMAAAMAKTQNAYVNGILVANATSDPTTLSAVPTAAELLAYVSRGAASVYTNTQRFARNIIMGSGQWANTMSLNDSGRPIYIASQPQNAGGALRPDSLRGNVAGLDLFADFASPAADADGSMIIVDPEAYTWYEGQSYQLRAESSADGSVNVGMYSFGACAIKIAAGAFRNNK